MHLWDTGGEERFRGMAPLYYRDTNVAVLKPIETVSTFNQKWSDHQPYQASLLLDNDCFVYDQIYDTLYVGKEEIHTKMLVPDSVSQTKQTILSIKEVEDESGKHIFTKQNFLKDSVTFTRSYDFNVVNGKIKSIRYLGIFD